MNLEREIIIGKNIYVVASFTKRFFATLLDILFVLSINIPMFLAIAKITGGTNNINFPSILNLQPKSTTVMYFILNMMISSLMFFVFMPIYYTSQTFFSQIFGIKAVTLDNEKPKIENFFLAYCVPIFWSLFVNLVYATFAGLNSMDIQYLNLKPKNFTDVLWMFPVKILFAVLVFIQLHYLFTVALNKNPINWFTRWSNLIYIDIKKSSLFAFAREMPHKQKIDDEDDVLGEFEEEKEEELEVDNDEDTIEEDMEDTTDHNDEELIEDDESEEESDSKEVEMGDEELEGNDDDDFEE